MKAYFHIDTLGHNWRKNDMIFVGDKTNHYWKSFAEKSDLIEINGQNHEVFKVTKAAYEAYAKIHPAPLKMNGYHFNLLNSLKESIDSLGNSIKLNRELIFESIRKEFYPESPSREKCIWLIPDNNDSLLFWNKILNSKIQSKIFKVHVDGKIHRAPQKWLIGGTISVNEWRDLAHNYWKGTNSGNIQDEILFTGTMKIIEEVTLPNKDVHN